MRLCGWHARGSCFAKNNMSRGLPMLAGSLRSDAFCTSDLGGLQKVLCTAQRTGGEAGCGNDGAPGVCRLSPSLPILRCLHKVFRIKARVSFPVVRLHQSPILRPLRNICIIPDRRFNHIARYSQGKMLTEFRMLSFCTIIARSNIRIPCYSLDSCRL